MGASLRPRLANRGLADAANPVSLLPHRGRRAAFQTFAALKQAFGQWNAGMLDDADAPSAGFTGKRLADHFGIDN